MTVAASRRNWPAVWHPLHWRLALSQWWHARDTHERARHHARQAEQAFATGRSLAGVSEFAVTLGLSPRMAWHRLLQPRLVGLGLDGLEHLIWKRDAEGAEFTGRHPDGWIGPIYRENLPWPAGAKRLRVAMQHNPQPNERHGKIIVELHLDGRLRATKTVKEGGQFEIATELADIKTATSTLELRVRPYFIPSDYEGSDNRKLTALLLGLHFE